MTSSAIWWRRVVLMVLLGLIVAIPVTLLIRGSGDDSSTSEGPTIDERLPLNPVVVDDRLQARYSVPEGWKLDRHDGEVLDLRSRDRSVVIGISSPGRAGDAGAVLRSALDSLRASYESVEVDPGSGRRLGGLPAEGAVVTAQGDDVDLRILVAVMAGEGRAYLVEVFTAASAPEKQVAQAQRFLHSLELRG